MMDVPLSVWLIFSKAIDCFAENEIVTRAADRPLNRTTYGAMASRAQQLMHALDRLDVRESARVGTLAWNSSRHLELYFAAPCSRRVLHTLNVRQSPDDLAYIIDHAGDEVLFVDADFLPTVAAIRDRIPSVRHVVLFDDDAESPADAHFDGVLGYEDLIAVEPDVYEPPAIDENEVMGLCYTSGTTGRPKGVPYTHRSTFLNALGVTSMAGMAIGPQDCVLPIVPMFHAGAWGMPYASTSVGAKLVFFAGPLDPPAVLDAIAEEEVTVTAGVPSVWVAMSEVARENPTALRSLRHIICGGSQPSPALMAEYERGFGVPMIQAWGMTETSPLAAAAWPQHRMRSWDGDAIARAVRNQAGLPLPGVEVRVVGDDGEQLPSGSDAMGHLLVRGPWVTDRYERDESPESFADGWFRTGDVAIRSADGYFVIADRTKDLIKSGGEWISSVAMESAICEIDGVIETAVIGIPDPRWDERPLPYIATTVGRELTLHELHATLTAAGFARWQLPSDFVSVDEIPKTAVGKADKKLLRRIFVHDRADAGASPTAAGQ